MRGGRRCTNIKSESHNVTEKEEEVPRDAAPRTKGQGGLEEEVIHGKGDQRAKEVRKRMRRIETTDRESPSPRVNLERSCITKNDSGAGTGQTAGKRAEIVFWSLQRKIVQTFYV